MMLSKGFTHENVLKKIYYFCKLKNRINKTFLHKVILELFKIFNKLQTNSQLRNYMPRSMNLSEIQRSTTKIYSRIFKIQQNLRLPQSYKHKIVSLQIYDIYAYASENNNNLLEIFKDQISNRLHWLKLNILTVKFVG